MIRNIMGKHEATACKPRASGDDPVQIEVSSNLAE